MSQEAGAVDNSAIRPFTIDVPEEQLEDFRRRIAATRWPSRSSSQIGRRACSWRRCRSSRYWTSDYDWRKAEAKLNALPQFTTEIDGIEIHFIHVRSQHEDALPLIMTHGWPRLGRRAARNRRPAHGPDPARRQRRGRVPPGAAFIARLRVLQ